MNKLWRFLSFFVIVLVFASLALLGVGLLTGGSFNRILYTTDIADMTKFFSREQIEMVVSFFFKT